MFSMKTQYALRAMASLARQYDEGPVLVGRLAESEHIPKKFLNLILLELKNHGLLESKKGKQGGYLLRKPPQEINLATIIRLTNGPLAPVLCVSALAYRRCDLCRDEGVCGIKPTMQAVRDAMVAILEHTTLADVARTEEALERSRAGVPAAFPA
jgi:Rrf2 family protein